MPENEPVVSWKEYLEALRHADRELYAALRSADTALHTEQHQHIIRLQEQALESHDKAQHDTLMADRDAVRLALSNVDRQRMEDKRELENWRENANEFRGQLKDQAGTFLTRDQFDQYQRNQEDRKSSSGTSLRGVLALGLTALGLTLSIVVVAANALFGK